MQTLIPLNKTFLSLFSLFPQLLISTQLITTFTLEIAEKEDERQWGLMGRSHLPDNHGMLFTQPKGCIWMFNVQIDLSCAFLNKNGVILEIADLEAYPEMMDSKRPVVTLADIKKYNKHDKVYQFFLKNSIPVPKKSYYVLEMNKGWFNKWNIKKGDKITWQALAKTGFVSRE